MLHRRFSYKGYTCILVLLSPFLFAIEAVEHPALVADQPAGTGEKRMTIGVVAPLDFELAPLLDTFPDAELKETSGVRFWVSQLSGGNRVVMTVCGTGKVNTAMCTTLLIREHQPDVILMIGTAGGLRDTLKAGDVCISASVCHHDMGVLKEHGVMHRGFRSPVPGKRTAVMYDADPNLVAVAQLAAKTRELRPANEKVRSPKVITGTIACGDVFLASEKASERIARKLNADAVEMEGAALAQVCAHFSTPWISIRGICDSSGKESGTTFLKLGHVAARNAAAVARRFLDIWNEEAAAVQTK